MLMVHKDNLGCSNVNEFEIVKNIKPWITLPKFREIINELKAMCIVVNYMAIHAMFSLFSERRL